MKILGISAYYHDSAAALIEDGKILCAAQEERFKRIKHDKAFPIESIKFCLEFAGVSISDIDAIVFYDKPFMKFERLVSTYLDNAPRGLISFFTSMPVWLKEKLFLKSELKKALSEIGEIDWNKTELHFSDHHLSHAASSFFASNFKNSAILTIDGVGEWATATISKGDENNIKVLKQINFPNSLGLLYSAFTYFLGFKVNSGEYKMMGLAPYGDRDSEMVKEFIFKIKDEIVEIFDDGSIEINQSYFSYSTSLKMLDESKFANLFNFKIRNKDETLNDKHISLALAIQIVTEEIVLKMTTFAKEICKSDNLCIAGGVALNCVANGMLKDANIFQEIYIQPAAGDAGGALGCALASYYIHFKKDRIYSKTFDNMNMARLGPSFTNFEIERTLINEGLKYEFLKNNEISETVSSELINGKVVAWFQGRMEFGPRALGSRSILANPLLKETQSILNLKVKKRESFRPFAPLMLEEEFEKYFGKKYASPYMLFVHKILEKYRKVTIEKEDLIEKINQERSVLPSISHIDYSSRIQTVNKYSDKKMFELLNKFKEKSKFGVLVNTSFNVMGEPIVCTPKDAINCFLHTDIDILVMENYIVKK